MLREHGYDGRIVSFEPVLPVFAALAKTAHEHPPWEAHRLALGSEDGTARLNVAASTDFSSFLVANAFARDEFGDEVAGVHAEQVPVRRLDSVLPTYLPP